VADRLDSLESESILILKNAGLDQADATLAVLLAVRGRMDLADQFVQDVQEYPSLERRPVAEKAVQNLLDRGWIVQDVKYDRRYLKPAANLREQLADFCGKKKLATRLLELHRQNPPRYLRQLGSLSEADVMESYHDLLRSAQEDFCQAMMSTDPAIPAAQIMMERAESGVSVRLLLIAPELVGGIWGEPQRQVARATNVGWLALAKKRRHFHVRVTHDRESIGLATCWSVDRRLVRYAVYDPKLERAHQGEMLEVDCNHGRQVNMVDAFMRQFDDAWATARRPGFRGALGYYSRRWWKWPLGVALLLAAIAVGETSGREVLAASGATVLLDALIESRKRLLRWIHRVRG
jgi:hypothetical protein